MTYFSEKPIKLIIKTTSEPSCNVESKDLYLSKTKLSEVSEYFKTMLFGNWNKNDDEFTIISDDVELDAFIITNLYSSNKLDIVAYNFEERYTIFLRIKYYCFDKFNCSELFECITPQDCIYIINNYQNFKEIDEILIKYCRLFFIDVYPYLHNLSSKLISLILTQLSNSPSFAKDEESIKKFYKNFGYTCIDTGSRNISSKELIKYSYLNNVGIRVYKMDYFIIYRLCTKYNLYNVLEKLNLVNMKDDHLFMILDDLMTNIVVNYNVKPLYRLLLDEIKIRFNDYKKICNSKNSESKSEGTKGKRSEFDDIFKPFDDIFKPFNKL